MTPGGERLVVVSNRLPVVVQRESDGQWTIRPGSGGLVTAMAPILRDRGGLWIGWPGTSEEIDFETILAEACAETGYDLRPVRLTAEEEKRFYHGFSNEILWPLFHDLLDRCNMDPDYWRTYRVVNRKFADVVEASTESGDAIWIHDYHLMSVARELRERGALRRTAFFLHIPFPSPDIFLKLPWRQRVLEDLLLNDLIGFQTQQDRQNFVQCVRTLLRDITVHGKGRVVEATWHDRTVRLGVFPIGIDYDHFVEDSTGEEVAKRAWEIHSNLPERQIILGIDRLDYTKGIPYRLEAFRSALLRYPELRKHVTLVQVVVPSREDIPEYQALRSEIEGLVGEINGQLTESGWIPIHYIFRNLNYDQLLGFYRTAEIALVTPLRDGMNLVAKEYCACSVEEDGVLILSEFAGAASQLHRGALLVNPFDVEGVGDVIHDAFRMDRAERRRRMKKLRHNVRKHNIFWWVDSFLQAAVAKDLHDFPPLDALRHYDEGREENIPAPGLDKHPPE